MPETLNPALLEPTSAATIAHLNIYNFMAQVEALDQLNLTNQAFVVANHAQARAVITGVSALAWREGLRRGMAVSRLKSKPDIAIVQPREPRYAEIQDSLAQICQRYTPRVESRGQGHIYLDLRGGRWLFGGPQAIALRLRREINQELGLVACVALARNRLVAKIASRVVGPGGFIVVEPNAEADFLAHQDIALLGLDDRKLARQLAALDFREIGDLSATGASALRDLLGPAAYSLHELANGNDMGDHSSAESSGYQIESSHDFVSDTNDPDELGSSLLRLVAINVAALRSHGWSAGRIRIRVGYSDGFQAEQQHKAQRPLRYDGEISRASRQLFDQTMQRRVRVRQISHSLDQLGYAGSQADLFPDPQDIRWERLQRSLDRNRQRYGVESVLPLSALTHRDYP